jgi:hypothetical protein
MALFVEDSDKCRPSSKENKYMQATKERSSEEGIQERYTWALTGCKPE